MMNIIFPRQLQQKKSNSHVMTVLLHCNGPTEAQNRFNLAVENFIRVFAKKTASARDFP